MGEHGDLWKQQIPKLFLPICTAGIIRRLNYGKPIKKAYAIAATSQGNVIICQNKTLLKAAPFPFSDTTQLLVFRVESMQCTEYLVAQSATRGIVLINLINFEVREAWPTAVKAEVFDWEKCGSPQLKIIFPGGESTLWNDGLLPQENGAPPELVLILKDRLQSAQENINKTKAEIHTKERMLASTLSRFHDAVSHVTLSEVPNLVPILKAPETSNVDATRTVPVLAFGPVSCQNLSTGLRIKFSVSNQSEKLIENLHCYVTTSTASVLKYYIYGEEDSSRPKELEPQKLAFFNVAMDYPVMASQSQKLKIAISGTVDGEHFSVCLKPIEFEICHNLFKNESQQSGNNGTTLGVFPFKKLIRVESFMHNIPEPLLCKFGDACALQPLNRLENTPKVKHYLYLARDKNCLKTYIHALYSLLPDDALILPVSKNMRKRTEKEILEECLNILLNSLLVNGVPVKVLPVERYREMCEKILILLSE